MQKPDFGLSKYAYIRWTPERLAYVRHLAEQRLSATQIALDIGIGATRSGSIEMICRKRGIKLQGRRGRPVTRPVPILHEVPETHMPALDQLSAKYGMTRMEIVRRLMDAMFDQGADFLDNLLDLGGAGD